MLIKDRKLLKRAMEKSMDETQSLQWNKSRNFTEKVARTASTINLNIFSRMWKAINRNVPVSAEHMRSQKLCYCSLQRKKWNLIGQPAQEKTKTKPTLHIVQKERELP